MKAYSRKAEQSLQDQKADCVLLPMLTHILTVDRAVHTVHTFATAGHKEQQVAEAPQEQVVHDDPRDSGQGRVQEQLPRDTGGL